MRPDPRVLAAQGYQVLPSTPETMAWAKAARQRGLAIAADPAEQARWLRHGGTWFVGVDALPTARDGAIGGVPLPLAPWLLDQSGQSALHPAQLSVTYPGYPGPGEGEAGHGYRVRRAAAHVDGLIKDGAARSLQEPHAVILGIALSAADPGASPLVVWPGSHQIMGAELSAALPRDVADWGAFDLAPVYQAARRRVFAEVTPMSLPLSPGEAVVLHRHLLHGIAPWEEGAGAAPEGRMVAYFRPLLTEPAAWRCSAS